MKTLQLHRRTKKKHRLRLHQPLQPRKLHQLLKLLRRPLQKLQRQKPKRRFRLQLPTSITVTRLLVEQKKPRQISNDLAGLFAVVLS